MVKPSDVLLPVSPSSSVLPGFLQNPSSSEICASSAQVFSLLPGLPPTPLAHGAQVKGSCSPSSHSSISILLLFPVSRLQNLQRPGKFRNVTRDLRSPLLSLQPGKAPNLPVTRTIQPWLRALNTQSQPPPLLTLIQLPSLKNSPFSANHFYHSPSQ